MVPKEKPKLGHPPRYFQQGIREVGTNYESGFNRYDMVSWDAGQNKRVFCFAALSGTFQEMIEALSPLGLPSWPCWHPVWEFSSIEAEHQLKQRVDFLLGTNDYVSAVLTDDLCRSAVKGIALSRETARMAELFKVNGALQAFESWAAFWK